MLRLLPYNAGMTAPRDTLAARIHQRDGAVLRRLVQPLNPVWATEIIGDGDTIIGVAIRHEQNLI